MGILGLKPAIRPAIYAIYGYVRLADEIVDSFHDFDKHSLLEQFKTETYRALEQGVSLNPILHAFQDTVTQYNINIELVDGFLRSMEMDLQQIDYTSELYAEYIHGSAEVVGLMCLQVFTEGNRSEYDRLRPFAMKLGSAFQKINFLRDLKDDYQILGRTYFPNVDLTVFDAATKTQIENEILQEFNEALVGIRMLPQNSRFGVYLAYCYYLSLFEKIRSKSAHDVLNGRIRVSNAKKIYLAASSYLRFRMASI